MRIALVPYKPGQEPEGMVSSLDPAWYHGDGYLQGHMIPEESEVIAAAVKAAKRDPWEEWRESLRLPWVAGRIEPSSPPLWVVRAKTGRGCDTEPGAKLAAAAPDMAEALRRLLENARDIGDDWTEEIALSALRKAGAPVDEPESAEDVPELWVSRDDGGWDDAWDHEPRWSVVDGWGVWEGRGNWRIPRRLADALALKPGDCRRVTKAEYERYFKPVLDLDPSERYAALERMVP